MILGTISSYTAGSGIALTIDGEDSPTTKDYKFLSSYSPTAGDRVLIEEIGDSYVVLGKLTDTASGGGGGGGDVSNLNLAYSPAATPNNTDALFLRNGTTNLNSVILSSIKTALSVKDTATTRGRIWFKVATGNVLQWGEANDGSYPQTWHNLASS